MGFQDDRFDDDEFDDEEFDDDERDDDERDDDEGSDVADDLDDDDFHDFDDDEKDDEDDDVERTPDDPEDRARGNARGRERKRRRKIEHEQPLPPDPKVWLAAAKMTRTETSLRLAFFLLRERHAASNVQVALSREELSRVSRPKFPVSAYLAQNGWYPETDGPEWRVAYWQEGMPFGIQLCAARDGVDVSCLLAPDVRLLAFTTGGPLGATRSRSVPGAIGLATSRAMFHPDVEPSDVVIVAGPRTAVTRKRASAVRESPLLTRAGLSICMVDRAGFVMGFPLLG